MMRVLKTCLIFAAMVFAALVIISTLLPKQIPNLKDQITTYINSSNTVIIDYQDLTFQWLTFGEFSLRPKLTFDQISMRLSQPEEAGMIEFGQAEIEINLVGSIVAGSLIFSSIKIDGSKIILTNNPIDGFLFNEIPIKKLLNLPELPVKKAPVDFKNINIEFPFGETTTFFSNLHGRIQYKYNMALVELENMDYSTTTSNMKIKYVSGLIEIARSQLKTTSMTGEFLGEPVSIRIDPYNRNGYTQLVLLRSESESVKLIDVLGLPLAESLTGTVKWEAEVYLSSRPEEIPVKIIWDVDLENAIVKLPETVKNFLDKSKKATFDIALVDSNTMNIKGLLGEELSSSFLLNRENDQWKLSKGLIQKSSEKSLLPKTETLQLSIETNFGQLTTNILLKEGGFVFDDIEIKEDNLIATGDVELAKKSEQAYDYSTTIDVQLKSTNTKALMEEFGFQGILSSKDLTIDLDLFWPNVPSVDEVFASDGTVKVKIKDGQITAIDPIAGKVLGLLSIAELPRRLVLDFSDIFKKGLSFNRLSAEFQFKNGSAYTCDLVMEGTSVDILLVGATDMIAKTYNQLAIVRPLLSDALPMSGAVFGGPGVAATVYLFTKLLRKPLKNIGVSYYSIEGSWDDPKIEKIPPQQIDTTFFDNCEDYLAESLEDQENLNNSTEIN